MKWEFNSLTTAEPLKSAVVTDYLQDGWNKLPFITYTAATVTCYFLCNIQIILQSCPQLDFQCDISCDHMLPQDLQTKMKMVPNHNNKPATKMKLTVVN